MLKRVGMCLWCGLIYWEYFFRKCSISLFFPLFLQSKKQNSYNLCAFGALLAELFCQRSKARYILFQIAAYTWEIIKKNIKLMVMFLEIVNVQFTMNRTAPVTGVTNGDPSKFGWLENLIVKHNKILILKLLRKPIRYQSITVRGTNPVQLTEKIGK